MRFGQEIWGERMIQKLKEYDVKMKDDRMKDEPLKRLLK